MITFKELKKLSTGQMRRSQLESTGAEIEPFNNKTHRKPRMNNQNVNYGKF